MMKASGVRSLFCCCALVLLFAADAGAERYLVLPPAEGGEAAGGLVEGRVQPLYRHLGISVVETDVPRAELARANGDRIFVDASLPFVASGVVLGDAAGGQPLSWHQDLAQEFQQWIPLDSVDPSRVLLFILDTGVRLDHPDLASHLLPELGCNVIDVDSPDDVGDDNGHGTAVAGMAGGDATGCWPALSLVPIKVADEEARSTLEHFAAAFDDVLGRAVDPENPLWGKNLVFNVSYSVVCGDPEEEAAVELFFTTVFDSFARKGCRALFCFSAGNSSADVAVDRIYPAALRHSCLVTVAAANAGGFLAGTFSNYGLTEVETAAPGENLVSTGIGGSLYVDVRGTSFAAPFLAGAAAALWAAHPGLRPYQVRNALLNLTGNPRWLSDHREAPSDYVVPVISGGAVAFDSLADKFFVAEAAGNSPLALNVVMPEEEPEGSGEDEGAAGGCSVGSRWASWLFLVPFGAVRRKAGGRR